MPVASTLRALHTGPLPAALNMAVDDVLLDAARHGGGPVLRTYGWSPPAISLGYAQRADEAVDVERCRALGIDLVRRPTGGRAVLHWEELTYSFHCADGEGPAAHPLQEACRILGECLADGLRRWGVDARLQRGTSPAAGRREACFSSTARWELTCDGRKLVGSAQRRTRGALLQHGSILAGPAHLRLGELIPPEARAAIPLERSSTHLAECGPADPDLTALAGCLAGAFADGLGLGLQSSGLSADERALAEVRAREVYGNDDYTFRLRRPAAAARP